MRVRGRVEIQIENRGVPGWEVVNIMLNIPEKYIPELRRAFANHKWDMTDNGMFIAGREVFMGNSCESRVNGEDPLITHNIVPKEGRVYLMKTALGLVSPESTLYIAMFDNAVSPVDGWTAANIGSGSGGESIKEFIGYSGNRPAWTKVAHLTESSSNNNASPASFTLTAGATIKGFLLTGNQNKYPSIGYNDGPLVSAIANERVGLVSGDVVTVRLELVYQNVA